MLLAPAVGSNSLSHGEEFDRAHIAAEAVSVFYSKHDDVLSSGFWLGEALSGSACQAITGRLQPLGLVGLCEPVEGVDCVNLSEQIRGHNPNTWMRAPSVAKVLATELGIDALGDLKHDELCRTESTGSLEWFECDSDLEGACAEDFVL